MLVRPGADLWNVDGALAQLRSIDSRNDRGDAAPRIPALRGQCKVAVPELMGTEGPV